MAKCPLSHRESGGFFYYLVILARKSVKVKNRPVEARELLRGIKTLPNPWRASMGVLERFRAILAFGARCGALYAVAFERVRGRVRICIYTRARVRSGLAGGRGRRRLCFCTQEGHAPARNKRTAVGSLPFRAFTQDMFRLLAPAVGKNLCVRSPLHLEMHFIPVVYGFNG